MRRQVVFLVFAFVAVISAAPAQNNTTQASDPANAEEVIADEPKQDAVVAEKPKNDMEEPKMDALQDEALMNKELGDDVLKADALEDEEFMKKAFKNEVLQGNASEDEDEFMTECEDGMLMLMLLDLDGEDEAALA